MHATKPPLGPTPTDIPADPNHPEAAGTAPSAWS